jgi:hypothetical protein
MASPIDKASTQSTDLPEGAASVVNEGSTTPSVEIVTGEQRPTTPSVETATGEQQSTTRLAETKTHYMFSKIQLITDGLNKIEKNLPCGDYTEIHKLTTHDLTSKEESYLKNTLHASRLVLFTAALESKTRTLNARQKEQGVQVAPAVLGKVIFANRRVKNDDQALREELAARDLAYDKLGTSLTFTAVKNAIKDHEKSRYDGVAYSAEEQTGWFDAQGRPKSFEPISNADFSMHIG